jgi:hypothetical protein
MPFGADCGRRRRLVTWRTRRRRWSWAHLENRKECVGDGLSIKELLRIGIYINMYGHASHELHLMGGYFIGVHLTVVCLLGVHLTGVQLMDVHLTGVHLQWA